MKRFKYLFRVILAVILLSLTTEVTAQDSSDGNTSSISVQNERANEVATAWLDSVDISLLTCGPGQEVWSYYGHTALRIQDKAHGSDVAVNWGMFSFKQDYFILRFVFGLTDYQIGIYPMDAFLAEYAAEGRWVYQQVIRLSRAEKLKILRAIEENAKPENRTYRYNFFYDNCTTRAREMILTNIGNCTNFDNTNTLSTYREEIHHLNTHHRWARFGNDLLLGFQADQNISRREWEFLPKNLCKDFATEGRTDLVNSPTATTDTNPATASKSYITLVDNAYYLIEPQTKAEATENAITPLTALGVIGILIASITLLEVYYKKNLWWLDTLLLVMTGLPGLILLAMVFSEHPTVQGNFQILILNPFNLLFAWKTAKVMRKGKLPLYYEIWGALLLLSFFTQIWQSYAEGMTLLALSLLVRYAAKSILLDLGDNKFGLKKFVVNKFIIKKKRRKNKLGGIR